MNEVNALINEEEHVFGRRHGGDIPRAKAWIVKIDSIVDWMTAPGLGWREIRALGGAMTEEIPGT